ncbi:MAG: hypothetical protein ACC628_09775 [Pirellulaceae bacterium]
MTDRFALFALSLLHIVASTMAHAAEPINIGDRRELFVDRALIDNLDGARLVLNRLRDEGVVLRLDKPWEGRFCIYTTVIRDGERFRCYYRGLPEVDAAAVTCYAESTDGIHWTKPHLGLVEVDGTKENNVLLADAGPVNHNFSPFLDLRPGVPSSERYKALGGTSPESGLIALVSADGIHWSKLRDEGVIHETGWAFDSQNVAFWSPVEQKYVAYYRKASEGIRSMARVTSDDFVTWSKPERMIYSDTGTATPSHHLYTNQTHPYFRAPHISIATAARFMPGRQVITPEQAKAIDVDPKYFGDTSDSVFMTTRGGNRYDRTFLGALIRPGIGPENWVSRTNYPALGVVQTGETEMSIYVNQNYGQRTAHLRRYSLRLDGFASARADDSGGELLTLPLIFSGKQLSINFATSAAGGIRVEVQTTDGKPVPGFTADDCREQIGNEIERLVSWKAGTDVSALAGKPIRLRFVMKDADLYSFRFQTRLVEK